MEIEKIAEILIYYVHAPLGGIALLSGGIALIAKKGNNVHKKSGKIFFFSMLFSAISAFIISVLPNHESPFLFSIGLFSTYFLISGLRSLKFKQKEIQLKTDKIIAYLITLIGIAMILYPIVLYSKLNIILTVFGVVGIVFGLRDLKLYKDIRRLKKNWLKLHLGKMTGGYIAAVSAFFVVNQILPGIWNWFVPGIVGSGYITYWMIKLNKKKKPVANKV
ncbi:DUF2306 domain-containing protein [Winogradskyella poriferorum]|uniref:DUF2306 domain-containing protein n=1 Tax=Winogradskyella poriferorum TaxID=307627 RepID=UPI003D65CCD0